MAKQEMYDAIIVGSGATGGWAAKELTQKGFKVAVLEAGRKLDPLKDYTEHTWPYELKFRGFGDQSDMQRTQPIQSKCYACNEYGRQFFVNDLENPYTTPPDKPFYWIRSRQVGGRSIPWGRQTYRRSNYDFKAASHDGFGDDWPISYEELAPYYDKAEEFIGVSGNRDGLPHLPDGNFMPGMKLNCGEQLLRKGAEKTNRHGISMRLAMLTGPPKPHMKKRARCHYCGNCGDGCDVGAMFNSLSSTLPVAEATGRMTLRPNSIVRHIVVDTNTGKAKGVAFVDRVTNQEFEAVGKIIVLGASTLESTRILLNSKSRQHPNGLGNSSGKLGHYLMDHFGGIGASGYFNVLASRDPVNEDGQTSGLLITRFRNINKATKQQRFVRGYGFECGSGARMFPAFAKNPAVTPGFGSEFKQRVRKYYTTPVSLTTRAEMLPRFENYAEIDPSGVVDAWGIPVLKIHIQYSDNEREMARDAAHTSEEILRAAGAEVVSTGGRISAPGRIIHELGTARMGKDSKTSVLNKFNQSWDVKNLFVIDGACFVTSANQNPTLTILALTMRACEYMADEYKRGNL